MGWVEVGVQEEPPVPSPRTLRRAGIKVVVAVPLERNIPSESLTGLWTIARGNYPLMTRPYDRTDNNRNEFARVLVENPELTHVCMLDLDQLHPGDTVERLARWVVHDPEKKIVSGLHFRRGEPFDPLAMVYDTQGGAHPIAEWHHPLIRCDVVGHGSILIHRSVFEQIPAPWWAYTYVPGRTVNASEDMYFCRLCHNAGIPIWVDTTLTAPHLITSVVDASSHFEYIAAHPELITSDDELQTVEAADG